MRERSSKALVSCLSAGAVFVMAMSFGSVDHKVWAASETRARLNIKPIVCVVDLVQDGTSQSLHVPSGDCLVPEVLQPITEPGPGQGQTDDKPAPVPPLVPVNNSWSPVGTTTLEDRQNSGRSFAEVLPAVMAGVGTVAAVTAVGVDAALFEFNHSKSAARWARSRLRLPI